MVNSLWGITLFNTFIGLENVGRNAAQYAKQQITNAKIDRILELLDGGGNTVDLHNYIDKVDVEIAKLIQSESVTATTTGERDLHYLFENRKHALCWAAEKSNPHAAYMGGMEAAAGNPAKSYFGG